MYKYRVFFEMTRGTVTSEMLTPEGLVPLLTPARVGEKIIFPSHAYNALLHGVPDWVLKQNAWEIRSVIHQIKGSPLSKRIYSSWSPQIIP